MSTRRNDRTAYGYARISRDDQRRGLGVERQSDDMAAMADRHGLTLAGVFVDNDRSASYYARNPETERAQRPEWDRLLAAVRSGECDTIVVYSPDRLTRDDDELARLLTLGRRCGLTILAEFRSYDLTTSDGRDMLRAAINRATYESERISERTRRAAAQRAQHGRQHWGRRPFGYTLPPRGETPEVVPDEAAVIRRMLSELLAGRSCTSIARTLNAEGIRSAAGKPWQAASVAQTISSPRTAGLREHHGQIIGPAAWPAIITPDERADALAALAALSTGPRTLGRRHVFTGFVRCTCGAPRPMARANPQGQRPVWRCLVRPDGGCGRSIPADDLELVTAAWIARRIDALRAQGVGLIRRPEWLDAPDEDGTPAGESVPELERQAARLAELFAAGTLTFDSYTTASTAIAERLDAARSAQAQRRGHGPLAAVVERLEAEEVTLAELWPELPEDSQRAVLSLTLERVEVGPGERGKPKAGEHLERAARRLRPIPRQRPLAVS